jgi:hypothetical protein
MGIRLIVEVLDHAPQDLTPSEVLVLLAIAEEANDTTRTAAPGMTRLARRARLKADSVRRVLQRLHRRGLKLRVAAALDRTGRPIYAYEGTKTVYRLPVFFSAEWRDQGPTSDTERGHGGPATGPESRDSAPAIEGQRGHGSPATGPERRDQNPALPLRHAAAASAKRIQIVMAAAGATETEAAAVVAAVEAARRPRNLTGLLMTLAAEGELDEWVSQVRAAHSAIGRTDWLSYLDTLAQCEHGVAGGHELDENGWCRCPVYRRRRTPQTPRAAS